MQSNLFSRKLWSKDFILILLICTIASYPNSILISVLPVYVLDLGGNDTLTGMMMGLTVLGMVTNIVVASLIDRIGRKKLLVLGSGLYALNALLFCFTKDLEALLFLRVFCGFTQGIFFPVPPIMAADSTSEDVLVDAMGLFGVAGSITFAVTPTVGLAIYNSLGAEALFISGAALGMISFILAIFVQEHYEQPVREEKAGVEKARKEKAAFQMDKTFLLMVFMPSLIYLFVSLGNSAVSTFLTPCGLSRGIGNISLFFMANQLAAIAARLLIGRVLSYISKRACVLAGIIISAAGTALIAVSYSLGLMLVSAILLGIGLTVVTQVLQAEVLAASPADRRGVASTVFSLLGSVGGMCTALWGWVATGAGYGVMYFLAGAATLAGCLFYGVYFGKRKACRVSVTGKVAVNRTGTAQ